VREPVDNARAPALFLLPVKNVSTDLPVKCNQFAIRAGYRALPRALDALLEFGEPVAIVLCPHGSIWNFGHSFGGR
jgi:hypothetical protein